MNAPRRTDSVFVDPPVFDEEAAALLRAAAFGGHNPEANAALAAARARNVTPAPSRQKETPIMATNAPTAPKAAKAKAEKPVAAKPAKIEKPAKPVREAAPAGSKWCSGAPTAEPPIAKHIGALEEFTTTSKSPDGRVGQCRKCFSAYRKAAVARAAAEAEALGIAPVKKERAPRAAKPEKIKVARSRKAKAEPVAEASDPAADKAASDALRAQVRANGGSIPATGDLPAPTPLRRKRPAAAPTAE